MHRHSHLLDIPKLLRNLCVVTILSVAFCHPVNAQEQTELDSGITNTTTTTTDTGNDIEGDFSNNYEDSTIDSNNQSETINYNGAGSSPGSNPVMSSIAPTVMGGGGNDSCLIPKTRGLQLNIIGLSHGEMQQDPNCNRRKNARLLGLPQQVGGLGLQVSAISVMCQDATVFRSMMLANTPCPINDARTGRLLMGRNAIMKYRENPALFVVGYELDQEFWNTLLRVGEEYNEEFAKDTTTKRSLSDQFRSSKRRDNGPSTNDDGAGKD